MGKLEDNKNILLPNYEHSILSTITSVLKYYNVSTNHTSLKVLDEKLKKRYKNIIFLVLDGMGECILNNHSKNGFLKSHEVDMVTSVYPSTTTAAMTSYYSGKAPFETGWIAWSQYFKEYGRALDMFSKRDSYERKVYENTRLDVFKEIMHYESVFNQIEKASPNVKAYEIKPTYAIRQSKRTLIADNLDEIIDNINLLCKLNEEKFILAYLDNPDGLLHKFGTDSEEVHEFILDTENKIENLAKTLDNDTLIIISADHGHKNIKTAYTLLDFPEIQECLIQPASFESRTVNFFVKEDMKKEFEERFNKVFSNEFYLMTKNEFLNERKMLGTGNKHCKIDDFVGNYIALSISDSIIRLETFLAEGKPVKKSTHCGLTKDEMEVPIIIIG